MPLDPTPDPDRTGPVDEHERERVVRFGALVEGATFANRYLVLERLGSGGSGEVLRAHDTVADLEVAIKVLYPSTPGSVRGLDRMRREIRILRELDHPGIVRVHDVGEAGGLLYVVMERLAGETLRERLAHVGPPDIDETARILDGLLSALGAAHARGVVHRDVKPANIFLAASAKGPARVVLLDFGLARAADDPRLTSTGVVLGTPAYMSPEQASGAEPSASSDLYSAGIVLWEMLHGNAPFEADSAVAMLHAHVTSPLPRPRRSARRVPGWADRLARWLLEKRPERRPPSATLALDWLRRRRTPLRRRALAAIRPGRTVAGAAALGLATAVALWPARVGIEDRRFVARSLLAVPVRTLTGPHGWTAAARTDAFPPARESLAAVLPGPALDTPARQAFPSLLARVDVLSGAVVPVRLRTWGNATLLGDLGFARFAPLWTIPRIVRTAFRTPSGDRLYAVVLAHHHHYPSGIAFADADGTGSGLLLHAGRIVSIVPDRAPSGEERVLCTAINNELGTRSAVFSVPASRLSAKIGTPPFDFETHTDRRTGFYVFLPAYARDAHVELGREPDALTVVVPEAGTIRLDPEDGMPLDPALRDGLEPEAWRTAQHRLLDVLETSTHLARRDDPGGGAALLEAFAGETASGSQRAVALGRASTLRAIEGRYDVAADDALRAAALEPEVPGHVRALLLARALEGRPADALERIAAGDAAPLRSPELGRDAVLALVANGDPDAAERTYRAFFPSRSESVDFYRSLLPAALALERGDDGAARMALRPDVYRVDGVFSFARALAWRAADDPAEARRWIATARRSGGSGHRLPLDLLEAWVAARHGGSSPDPAVLDLDLAAQRLAARRSVTDLWALRWAERLYADLAGPPA